MEKNSLQDVTLVEVAAEFLTKISPESREQFQAEIYKCVRWFGFQRKPGELKPADVANYAGRIIPSEGKSLKSFLTYLRKNGLTSVNLAVHARPKKTTLKASASSRGTQEQAMLTEEGYARMKEELGRLEAQIPEVIREIQKAAADKDFRENAPLAAAREEKSRLSGRILELKATLKMAKTVNSNLDASKAEVGNTVLLSDASSGREFSYLLVDPREANPRKGKLSVASPLGKVLLGKEKGQTVSINAPAGTFSYCIENVQHA
ncbi:MAG: GreA/GreB family elongation factor [Dehalococcoidia bacterium]|nr:GreA/GreB family elongation factor [Dehalococcoidia bacterium]